MTAGSAAERKYELTWAEEFDLAPGAQPDPKVWNFDLGDGTAAGIPGWGNSEREYYLPEAAAFDGQSNLVVSATRQPADNPYGCYYGTPAEWTSAKLTTLNKLHFRYGRIEGRLQIPKGLGTWPAFWMLGSNIASVPWPQCGEIDIMEARGDLPTTLYGTVHGPEYFGDQGLGTTILTPAPMADDFHTFAIDWLPDEIRWYFDGELFHQTSASEAAPKEWVFNHDFYLVFNLAMGGHFTGPIDPALNSAEYKLDYIRHYSIDGVGEVITCSE